MARRAPAETTTVCRAATSASCVAGLAPTLAFRSLLQSALGNSTQSTCVLVEATKEIDWALDSWWRRGRVELPVQRRARLRYYRHVRH